MIEVDNSTNQKWISCYSVPLAEETRACNIEIKRKEITAWLNQLRRCFPGYSFSIMEGTDTIPGWFVKVSVPICSIKYNISDVLGNLPYNWDEEARQELGPDYFNIESLKYVPKKDTEN